MKFNAKQLVAVFLSIVILTQSYGHAHAQLTGGPGGGPYCAIIALPITNLTNTGFTYEIKSMGEMFPMDDSVAKWYESTVKDMSTGNFISTGPYSSRFTNDPGRPHYINVTDLKEDTDYEVFVRFYCDGDQSQAKSTTKTITVRTLKYVDEQISPDEDAVIVVTTPPIDKIVTPPSDPLDCDGATRWANPSAGPRVNTKICPPLNLGVTNQAKGGKPRADSQFHVYETLSADTITSFKGLSSENLATTSGSIVKLCSNNNGKIIICGGSTSIKPAKLDQSIRFNGSDWIGTERVKTKVGYDYPSNITPPVSIGFDYKAILPNNVFAKRVALILNGNLQLLGPNYNTTAGTGIIKDLGWGRMGWEHKRSLLNDHFKIVKANSNSSSVVIDCTTTSGGRYPIAFSGGGVCHSGMVEWDNSLTPVFGNAGDMGGRISVNGYNNGIDGLSIGSHSALQNSAPDQTSIESGYKYYFQCTEGPVTAFAICMKK